MARAARTSPAPPPRARLPEKEMRRIVGFALALALALLAVARSAEAAEQRCTTQVANLASPACGDANRGKILYGQVPGGGVTYTWSCNQCHSDSPLTDKLNSPAPAPSLIRAAPRDPGYIQYMMYKQPEAVPIIAAMETCCIADRPPNNAMGDLGDIAEFLYTCKIGIAPCVVGGGGGGAARPASFRARGRSRSAVSPSERRARRRR
jgi:mono/diheme cytochrome c family protein